MFHSLQDTPDPTEMYPPPPKTVLDHLKAVVLDAIIHGKYVVALSFDGGNKLSIKAPFRYAEKEKLSTSRIHDFPLVESSLVRALGHEITDVGCGDDGTLQLLFSNGDALVVYANNPKYEAYTLVINGKEYII